MTPRIDLTLALAAALCACPSPAPRTRPTTLSATPAATPARPADLRPAALRVLSGEHLDAEMSPDGAIAVDGSPWARLEGARVVALDGRELARAGDDGAVTFAGAAHPGRLSADGSLTAPDGARMTFTDDGHVRFTEATRSGDHVTLRARVEGLTEASRPAAAVLVGVLMFRARATRAD